MTTKTVLDEMDMAKLRQYAKHMHVPLARTDTRDDIVEKIISKKNSYDVPRVVEAGDRPEPGWAFITMHMDNSPRASNKPLVFDVNGYKVGIPRGVERVPVPIKVVEHLRNLKESRAVPDPNDPNKFIMQEALSFPFSVDDINPGPDPRPSEHQKQQARRWKPKFEYKELFGHFPNKLELTEAIKEGFITITPDNPDYLKIHGTDLKAARKKRIQQDIMEAQED